MIGTAILSHSREKSVRIFRWMFVMTGLVFTQDHLIHVPSIDPKIIWDTLHSKLKKESALTVEYQLKSFSVDTSKVTYHVINTFKVVDSLILSGANDIRPSVLQQIIQPYRTVPAGEAFSQVGKELVSRYYFLNYEPEFQFGLMHDNTLGALISIIPAFESHFSGVFGLNRQNKNWELNGEVNLHLENLARSADDFDLYWKRTDSLSQVIQLGISLPHPFSWNIGMEWKYNHEVIGGLYTFIEARSLLHTFVPGLHGLKLGYIKGITRPTDKGDSNGYDYGRYRAFSLSSKRDTRNDRFMPSRGVYAHTIIDGGLQDGSGFVHNVLEIQTYFPVTANLHGLIKWIGKGIHMFSTPVPKSRYEWFGGTASLRGYREQEFSAPQFQVASLEMGYKAKSSVQTTLFLDIGSDRLNILATNWLGYGIGLSQVNENSIIRLEYALSNHSISKGKLHIKWISRL